MRRILGVFIILVLVVGVASLTTSAVRTPGDNPSSSPALRSALGPTGSGAPGVGAGSWAMPNSGRAPLPNTTAAVI